MYFSLTLSQKVIHAALTLHHKQIHKQMYTHESDVGFSVVAKDTLFFVFFHQSGSSAGLKLEPNFKSVLSVLAAKNLDPALKSHCYAAPLCLAIELPDNVTACLSSLSVTMIT